MTDPTNLESPNFVRPASPPMNSAKFGLQVIAFLAGAAGLIMAIAGAATAAESLDNATLYHPADTSGLAVSSIGMALVGVSVAVYLGLMFYAMAQWDKANPDS